MSRADNLILGVCLSAAWGFVRLARRREPFL